MGSVELEKEFSVLENHKAKAVYYNRSEGHDSIASKCHFMDIWYDLRVGDSFLFLGFYYVEWIN